MAYMFELLSRVELSPVEGGFDALRSYSRVPPPRWLRPPAADFGDLEWLAVEAIETASAIFQEDQRWRHRMSPSDKLLLQRETEAARKEVKKVLRRVHLGIFNIERMLSPLLGISIELGLYQTDVSGNDLIGICLSPEKPNKSSPLVRRLARTFRFRCYYSREVWLFVSIQLQQPSSDALFYKDVQHPPHCSISNTTAEPFPTQANPRKILLVSRDHSIPPAPLWWSYVSPNKKQHTHYHGQFGIGLEIDGQSFGQHYDEPFRVVARWQS